MKQLLIFLLAGIAMQGFAQDIRGAYISTKYVSSNNYSITLVLYNDPAIAVSRPTVTISFGDGTTGTFFAAGTPGSGRVTYAGTHAYGGAGTYVISFMGVSRVAGIRNMANSQAQQLYVKSTLVITSVMGINSTPEISYDPPGMSGSNTVLFNPGGHDTDGDSLSYSLTDCYGMNYYIPAVTSLNGGTGLFNFSNDTTGMYAFSFIIKDWRKGTNGVYMNVGSSQLDFVTGVSGTVGLNEITGWSLETLAWPNPVKDKLNIQRGQDLQNCNLEIWNSQGELLQHVPASENTIDLSIYASGIYFIRIQSAARQKVIRVIKE